MGESTKISWCDSTINFHEGCTKVSPGCANCYAEARDRRMMIEPVIHWGKGAPRRKIQGAIKAALALNRRPWICDSCGNAEPDGSDECQCGSETGAFGKHRHRRRIFSLSLGDWLDDEVPVAWLAEMLGTIQQCDQVTWILCTKRPENFTKRLTEVGKLALGKPGAVFKETPENEFWWWVQHWLTGEQSPKNVILLASIENQEQAEKRIPELLRIPAACRGLSLEPLLSSVDLSRWFGYENKLHGRTGNLESRESGKVSSGHAGQGMARERAGGEQDSARSDCEQDCPRGQMEESGRNNSGLHQQESQPKINWQIIGGESGSHSRPCNVDWIRSLVRQGRAAGVATFVKQFSGKKSGEQGELPDELFNVKQFPSGF